MMSEPTAAAASGVAHFSISGDWLTEHVRERMLSDMEESALTLLVEHLDGMTYEQALAVLLGEKRLTGVNDLELVDEDPDAAQAWHGTLLGRYGIRSGSVRWRRGSSSSAAAGAAADSGSSGGELRSRTSSLR